MPYRLSLPALLSVLMLFGGLPFTEVFIWGSYDGNVVFAEPITTRGLLESRPNHEETLAQPEAHRRAGRYTSRYVAERGGFEIELGGLVQRTTG